jgi:nitrile hydratase beta subunit
MNGIHDMGGMQDMGPIRIEKDEPVFHAKWEARAFALEFAVPGDWQYSEERFHIESIPPSDYLRMPYYEKWLTALTAAMVKNGMATRVEIESGIPTTQSSKAPKVLSTEDVATMFVPAAPASRAVFPAALFRAKAQVRARNMNPVGHTRLPRYARGKRGTVERDYGVFDFPDTSAHGLGLKPQHVYAVRFTARELWGEQASPLDSVYIDLWDDYLEPA